MTTHAALVLLLSCLAGRPVCPEAAEAVRSDSDLRAMALEMGVKLGETPGDGTERAGRAH